MNNNSISDFSKRYPERMKSISSKVRGSMEEILMAMENGVDSDCFTADLARTIIEKVGSIVSTLMNECKDDEFASALWPAIESNDALRFVLSLHTSSKNVWSDPKPHEKQSDSDRTRKFLLDSSEFLARISASDDLLRFVWSAFVTDIERMKKQIRSALSDRQADSFNAPN